MGSYPYERRDFSRSAELYTVEYGFFLLLLASDMPLLQKSFFDKLNILCEGPCEKARPVCRQENGSMHIPPMEMSFSHQNMSQLSQVKNPIIRRIFVGNPDHQCSKCFPNQCRWDIGPLYDPPPGPRSEGLSIDLNNPV